MSFFVRRAMRLPQIRSQVASITQRRGLADSAAAKVHFWQQPLNPRNWKYGEIGFVSLLVSLPIYIYYNESRLKALAALEKLHNENKEDLSDEGSSVWGANQGSYHIRASRRA